MPHPRELSDEDFHKKFEWPVRTCMQNQWALSLLPKNLREERNLVLSVVRLNGDALKLAPTDLKDDDEVACLAIQQDGMAARFASQRLKADPNFMMEAFKKDMNALSFASSALLSDASFMLEAVRHSSVAIRYFPDELKADRELMEVVMEISAHKDLLQHAAPALQSATEFVMLCVTFNGLALEHADPSFQDKKEIVMAAVQQNGLALEFVSRRLRNDHHVVLAAVSQDGAALVFAPVDLRKDRKILLAATRGQPQLEGRLAAVLGIKGRAETAPAAVRNNLKKAWALEYQRPSSAAMNSPEAKQSNIRPSSAAAATVSKVSSGKHQFNDLPARFSSEATLAMASVQLQRSGQKPSRRELAKQKKQQEEKQWREALVPAWAPRLTELCRDDNVATALATRSASRMLEAEVRGDDPLINAIVHVPSTLSNESALVPTRSNAISREYHLLDSVETDGSIVVARGDRSKRALHATQESQMTTGSRPAITKYSPTKAVLEDNRSPLPLQKQWSGLGLLSPLFRSRSNPTLSPAKTSPQKSPGKAETKLKPEQSLKPIVSPISQLSTTVGSPSNDGCSTNFPKDARLQTRAVPDTPQNIRRVSEASIGKSVSIGRTERTFY